MLPNKAFPHRGEGGPQGRMRGQMGDRRADEDIRPYVVLASFISLVPSYTPGLTHSAARPLPNVTAALGHVGGPIGFVVAIP